MRIKIPNPIIDFLLLHDFHAKNENKMKHAKTKILQPAKYSEQRGVRNTYTHCSKHLIF